MRDAMNILIRPVVSEKTYALMDTGTYVFVVTTSKGSARGRMAVIR